MWAHDAPICFLPDHQMLVYMPSCNLQRSDVCQTALLTDCALQFSPASLHGNGLAWTLSACGTLLVNSGQDSLFSRAELPNANEGARPEPSTPHSRHMWTQLIPCAGFQKSVVPLASMGPTSSVGPLGMYHKTIKWHPAPSNSRMYAACNHAGDICLVDGRVAEAVHVWPRQQLEPADNPAGSGPVDLDWSPDGETLIVSHVGRITFLHFGHKE